MKLIITICFILAVAIANPHWGNYRKEWNKPHRPPGNWFPHEDPHMLKCAPPPGPLPHLPGHLTLSLNSLLEYLFTFKSNQKNNPMESCTAVWVCRKPETGEIIITEMDGTRTLVSEQSPNESNGRTSSTERNPQDTKDVEDTNQATTNRIPPQKMVATEPSNVGVGIIDIRSSMK